MSRPNSFRAHHDLGYDIKGYSKPRFNLKPLKEHSNHQDLDVPNGELQFGKALFIQYCSPCHRLDIDTPLGPALRTVYLRRAGQRRNFLSYSEAMATSRTLWTKSKLWKFLQNPEQMIPGTYMDFEGFNNPLYLASVVEYLHFLRINTMSGMKNKEDNLI